MDLEVFIVEHELIIRLGFFFGILVGMGLWERIAPRRAPTVSKALRWLNNLGLVFLDTIILRLLFPAAAVGVARFAQVEGWGLLNAVSLDPWLAALVAVVALDFVVWLTHVLAHALPAFWRIHRVHHADLDYDVTTGARFHPLEIVLAMLIKFLAILLLGPSVAAVVIFEVLLNATAMFNHGNVGLPARLDRFVRLFLVTPDMHRVHHSVEDDETNSNFGFNLPWWDYLFGTYRAAPRAGQLGMTLGIHRYRDPKRVNQLPGMLALPFVGKVEDYVINQRSWAKPGDDA